VTHRLTIAVAESVTCGRLQAKIGERPNLSELFRGGVTAYSIDQKVKLLGIDAKHASRTNCVSPRVTDEMAMGVCSLFGVEIGIATTGCADSPARGKAPFGFWSLCRNDGSCLKIVARGKLTGTQKDSRRIMQKKIADHAFQALIRYLNNET
jgi:nicotinamide-nucleotide amidase